MTDGPNILRAFGRSKLAVIAFLLLEPIAAHAHGGGRDTLGCHHNQRAGGYHCYRGALAV